MATTVFWLSAEARMLMLPAAEMLAPSITYACPPAEVFTIAASIANVRGKSDRP